MDFDKFLCRVFKVLLCISTFIVLIQGVNAYVVPENKYFISGRDVNLGDVYIMFSIDSEKRFSVYENQPINVTGNTYYGYCNYGNNSVSIRFQPFEYGQYRFTSSGYYQNLVLEEIYDTNLNYVKSEDTLSYINTNMILYVSVALIGGLLWLIFMKHS